MDNCKIIFIAAYMLMICTTIDCLRQCTQLHSDEQLQYPTASYYCNEIDSEHHQSCLKPYLLPNGYKYFTGERDRRLTVGLPDWYINGTLAELDSLGMSYDVWRMDKTIIVSQEDAGCWQFHKKRLCRKLSSVLKVYFLMSAQSFMYGKALGDPQLIRSYMFLDINCLSNRDTDQFWTKFAKQGPPLFSASDRMVLLCYGPLFVMFIVIDLLTLKALFKEKRSRTFAIHIAVTISNVAVYITTVNTCFPLLLAVLRTSECLLLLSPPVAASFSLSWKLHELSLSLKNVWLSMLALDGWKSVWTPTRYSANCNRWKQCAALLFLAAIVNITVEVPCIINWLHFNKARNVETIRFFVTRTFYFAFHVVLMVTELWLSVSAVIKLFSIQRANKHSVQNGRKCNSTVQSSACLLLFGTTVLNSLLTSPHILMNVWDVVREATDLGIFNFIMKWNMELFPALPKLTMIYLVCVFHSGCILGFWLHIVFIKSYRETMLRVLRIRKPNSSVAVIPQHYVNNNFELLRRRQTTTVHVSPRGTTKVHGTQQHQNLTVVPGNGVPVIIVQHDTDDIHHDQHDFALETCYTERLNRRVASAVSLSLYSQAETSRRLSFGAARNE